MQDEQRKTDRAQDEQCETDSADPTLLLIVFVIISIQAVIRVYQCLIESLVCPLDCNVLVLVVLSHELFTKAGPGHWGYLTLSLCRS